MDFPLSLPLLTFNIKCHFDSLKTKQYSEDKLDQSPKVVLPVAFPWAWEKYKNQAMSNDSYTFHRQYLHGKSALEFKWHCWKKTLYFMSNSTSASSMPLFLPPPVSPVWVLQHAWEIWTCEGPTVFSQLETKCIELWIFFFFSLCLSGIIYHNSSHMVTIFKILDY